MAVSSDGLYIGGVTSSKWKIEKRNPTTGALIAAFGTAGTVTSTAGNEIGVATIKSIALDSALFAAGYSSDFPNFWHTEKRDLTTGALVGNFGEGGVQVGTLGEVNAIVVDPYDGLYLAGRSAPTSTSSLDDQWRIEKRAK